MDGFYNMHMEVNYQKTSELASVLFLCVIIAGVHLVVAQRDRKGRSLLEGQLLRLLRRRQTQVNTCTNVVNEL